MDALSAGTLREWIALQKVTRKRMSNLLLPMRNALSEALADEVIAFNPLDRLRLSRILPRDTLTTDYEPDPYTVEELVPLLVSMHGAERAAFQFWAYTGIRTSELVALSWPAVDLTAWTAHIHMAVVEGEEKGTKTRAGKEWTDQSLLRLWQRTCKKGKARYRNPYQMRHTFASTALTAGANPWCLADQLGHEDATMVFTIYGKFIGDDYKKPKAQFKAVQ